VTLRQPPLPGFPATLDPPQSAMRLPPAGKPRPTAVAALREIEEALARTTELSACLQAIAQAVLRFLRTDHVQITLWDEATQSMQYAAVVEREAEADGPVIRVLSASLHDLA